MPLFNPCFSTASLYGLVGRMYFVCCLICLNFTDIKNVQYVINFDFPNGVEDYIHRIGRTGRAGAKGTAITFFTSNNAKHARELINLLKEAGQAVPPALVGLQRSASAYGDGGRRRYGSGRGRGRRY